MKKILIITFVLIITSYIYSMPVNVYDSNDNYVGTIFSISTAQTGAEHFNVYSASGHPSGVNIGPFNSSIWVHENTNNGELSFGFFMGQDGNAQSDNSGNFLFSVNGSAADPYVSIAEDTSSEFWEGSPNVFHGQFGYGDNADGMVVSNITGNDWIININSVNLGNIVNWYAASGETTDFSDDIILDLNKTYYLTPANIPEPATIFFVSIFILAGIVRQAVTK